MAQDLEGSGLAYQSSGGFSPLSSTSETLNVLRKEALAREAYQEGILDPIHGLGFSVAYGLG